MSYHLNLRSAAVRRAASIISGIALATASMPVLAAPITCLPKPFGAGTSALFKSATKGDFVAWYCPGEQYPSMVVCLKATCSLVGSKRAAAQFLSDPSVAGLAAALAPYSRDPLNDPELVQVWKPYAAEIRALSE